MLTEVFKIVFRFYLVDSRSLIKDVNCRRFRLEFRLLINKFGVGTWLKHVIKPKIKLNRSPKPFWTKNKAQPPSLSLTRDISLSSLSIFFFLLCDPPCARPREPRTPRFSTQPSSKPSIIHLPSLSRTLCCSFGGNSKDLTHASFGLGCDSTPLDASRSLAKQPCS